MFRSYWVNKSLNHKCKITFPTCPQPQNSTLQKYPHYSIYPVRARRKNQVTCSPLSRKEVLRLFAKLILLAYKEYLLTKLLG